MAEAYINIDHVVLECPICLDRLDRPRSLPCLHTFCTKCLREHILMTYQVRAGFTFHCPVCRTQTRPVKPFTDKELWAEHFPVNYWIQSVLDEANKSNLSDNVVCELHEDMKINLFCQDHNIVVCPTCVAIDHRKCDNILEIDKFLSDISLGTQVDKLDFTLSEREKKVLEADKRAKEKLSKLDNERKKIEETAQHKKEGLIFHIDQLYNKFNQDLEKMFTEIITDVREEENVIQDNRQDIVEIRRELESVDIDNSPRVAFIKLNKVSKHLQEMPTERHQNENTMGNMAVEHVNLETDGQVKKILSFGELQFCRRKGDGAVESCPLNLTYESFNEFECNSLESDPECDDMSESMTNVEIGGQPATIQASSTRDVTSTKIVSLDNDKNLYNCRMLDTRMPRDADRPSWISSMCRARTNVHVLCDQNGSSIKLLHENKLVFELHRRTKPWGVCRLSESRIAVTFPEECCIHIYETHCNKTALKMFGTPSVLSQTLKLQKVITTNGQPCYGIASLEDLMFVACESSLNVYSTSGSLLNCVHGSDANTDGFIRVMDVTLNPFRRTCYLSDEGGDCVYAFDVVDFSIQKCPKFIYNNSLLKSPQGIDFDIQGRVYICGFVSRNIHVVTFQGQTVKVITTGPQPWTVCLDSSENQMFVSFFPENPRDVNMFVCKMLPISHGVLPTQW